MAQKVDSTVIDIFLNSTQFWGAGSVIVATPVVAADVQDFKHWYTKDDSGDLIYQEYLPSEVRLCNQHRVSVSLDKESGKILGLATSDQLME